MSLRLTVFFALLVLVFTAPVAAEQTAPETLDWETLMPQDFRPDDLFDKYKIDELEDGDPLAVEFMRELKAAWKAAPVVESLDGRLVKLPGFVVPLETRGEEVVEFFLVPYFGACIHVPPPPANQMIYVVMPAGKGLSGDVLNGAIWVSGKLSIKRTSNELGDAGYMMQASLVEPYEE